MKKRIIAIILVLMMAVTLLPAAAMAEEEGIYLSVNGVAFTGVDQTIKCGSGTATLTWPYSNPRLILNNANITSFAKIASDADGAVYAGIFYQGSYELEIYAYNNNTIAAPSHSEKNIYEGIVCDGKLMLEWGGGADVFKMNINNTDIGIEMLESGNNLRINGVDTVINNAKYAGIIADKLSVSGHKLNVSCSGPFGILCERGFDVNSANVSVSVTPDARKYNGCVGISAASFDMMTGDAVSLNVNANMDASAYTGNEPVAVTGIITGDFSPQISPGSAYVTAKLDSSKMKGSQPAVVTGIICDRFAANCYFDTNIELNGRSIDGAAGIIVQGNLNKSQSMLNTNVVLKGSHDYACAISAKTMNTAGRIVANLTGANPGDAAVELLDSASLKNNGHIYAVTDCASSEYGALVMGCEEGTEPDAQYLAYPQKGSFATFEDEGTCISIAENPDGTPARTVVISNHGHPFIDIDKINASFKTSAIWAAEQGITTGVTPIEFRPDATCTRGQVVTFLWRANGSPEPETTENPFVDVSATGSTAPYYKAILWAYENGITTGFDATHFKPSNPCTRGQVVTFLWRAEGKPAPENTANPFSDVSAEGRTAPYYDAIIWAADYGVTGGYEDGTFRPNNTCTRAHIVTFLYRCMMDNFVERVYNSYEVKLAEPPEDGSTVETRRTDGVYGTYGETIGYVYVEITYNVTDVYDHHTEDTTETRLVRFGVMKKGDEFFTPTKLENIGSCLGSNAKTVYFTMSGEDENYPSYLVSMGDSLVNLTPYTASQEIDGTTYYSIIKDTTYISYLPYKCDILAINPDNNYIYIHNKSETSAPLTVETCSGIMAAYGDHFTVNDTMLNQIYVFDAKVQLIKRDAGAHDIITEFAYPIPQ